MHPRPRSLCRLRPELIPILSAVCALVASAAGAQVNVPLGDLPSGTSVTIEFVTTVANPVAAGVDQVSNQGTGTGTNFPAVVTNDPDTGPALDPTLTAVTAEPAFTLVKSDGGATAIPGGTLAYTLTYTNVGNQGASGVTLMETVPANTTFNPGASTAGWACLPNNNAGSVCTLAIGGVAGGGGSAAAIFAVDVVAVLPAGVDQIANTAMLSDDGNNSVAPATASGGDTTPVTAAPDLVIVKDDGGATTAPGGTVVYTLDYSNPGNQDATGVTLTETVPVGTTFNPGASTAGWSCAPNNNAGSTCTLAIGALAGGGGNGSASFAVDVANPVPAGLTQISNDAEVADDAANGADPNPGDNSDSDTTPVTAEPAFTLSKSDGGTTAVPGGVIAYVLTYSNTGNQGATGVELTETVPVGTTFDAGSSTAGWSCADGSPAGTPCTLMIGAVAGGAGGMATFAVTVLSPAPAGLDQVVNAAGLTDDGQNSAAPATANGGDTTPVDAAPDLTIDKSYGGPTPLPGDTVDFDLDWTNDGTQGATTVVITETVPTASTFNPGASTAGWVCLPNNNAGSTCTLDLGEVPGGASGTAVFAVDLDDPLPPGTPELVNTASIGDDGTNGADLNPADNEDTESITLDSTAPSIDLLTTATPTPDDELTECETATVPIATFFVTFSEDVRDPPGNSDPDDVTNPDNYLLVSSGPDVELSTVDCTGPAGDDVEVPIVGVTYDNVALLATVDPGGVLPNAQYRLFVCAGIRDDAGNLLDGDGDGTGGDDFQRQFREDAFNLFANGHFDCDDAGWQAVASAGGGVAHDPSVDVDGSPDSGAEQATVLVAGATPEQAGVVQCLRAFGEVEYELSGRGRLSASGDDVVALSARCEFFAGPACAGGSLGVVSQTLLLADTAGGFLPLATSGTSPAGSNSVQCGFFYDAADGIAFDGWLDGLTLFGPIFADGFESGDTTAWSAVAP